LQTEDKVIFERTLRQRYVHTLDAPYAERNTLFENNNDLTRKGQGKRQSC
jgi:hypothetical protein